MNLLVTVLGVVQGVGYRPFVARLAKELDIKGTVRNSGGNVHILAQGDTERLDLFVRALSERRPPDADVIQILTEPYAGDEKYIDFQIDKSSGVIDYTPLLPADLPVCPTCMEELNDSTNRRFGYSFISCVDCGPRFSIVETIPYDRGTITMNVFPMCPSCSKEYEGDDRRRHAQTISCSECGPQLIFETPGLTLHKDKALSHGIEILIGGGVLAIKGIGGYQLACRPDLPAAVDSLRKFKNRDRKPFAVMFPNLNRIKDTCIVSLEEEKLLLSSARPIVLLSTERPKLPRSSSREDTFCPEVIAGSRFLGAFLPYTALHHQLTEACGPLIMTSANLSGEPILFRDEDALLMSSPYLSGVLYNTRRIVTPLDDSVARVVSGKSQVIRRSRGYVPSPVILSENTPHTILAMGGDLKSSFCLYQNDRAYLSQYFGDMESYQVQKNYRESIVRMQNLFHLEPDMLACDLHPLYRTSAMTEEWNSQKDIRRTLVQHHHAHAASVLAEHGIDSCIGVTFDGTGYGTDGAIWGGEFLLLNGAFFTRAAHLSYLTLCGADEAARKADLTEACYLSAAGEELHHKDASVIRAALLEKTLTQQTSSMGRLFDAVSSLLGICQLNSYEGECAVMLENAAAEAIKDGILPYPLHFAVTHGMDESTADQVKLFEDIYRAVKNGGNIKALALGFHMAIIEMVVTLCLHIREKSGETRVALSGGVFTNLILAEKCEAGLVENGFAVYINQSVPANDGGICLGQAWICGQMLK